MALTANNWMAPLGLKAKPLPADIRAAERAAGTWIAPLGNSGRGGDNDDHGPPAGNTDPPKTYGDGGNGLRINAGDQPGQSATPIAATGLINKSVGLYNQAGDVFQRQMDGSAYAPLAAQNLQALGRAEANQRAKTANAIHSAGFSGTAIGGAAGNAAEADMLRNRFDTNLGIEVERQNLMNTGANNAMQFGGQINAFEQGQMDTYKKGMDIDSALRDKANTQILSDNAFWMGLDKAIAAGMEDAYMNQYLTDNPQMANMLASLNGGKPVTGKQALDIMNNAKYAADEYGQTVDALMKMIPGASRESIEKAISTLTIRDLGLTDDGKGGLVPADTVEDEDKKVKSDAVAYASGEKPFSTFKGSKDSEEYESIKKQTTNVKVNNFSGRWQTGGEKNDYIDDSMVQLDGEFSRSKVFDDAFNSGAAVQVNGTLYYVKDVKAENGYKTGNLISNKWWSGQSVYTLYDPVTKSEIVIRSGRKEV